MRTSHRVGCELGIFSSQASAQNADLVALLKRHVGDGRSHSLSHDYPVVSSLHKIMTKDKADKYIRDLMAMKPVLVESMLPAGERVGTGEILSRLLL